MSSSGYFNPYTNSYSWEDDLRDHPQCRGKILDIARRLNIQKEEIHYQDLVFLCGEWGCMGREQFMDRMNSMSNDELRAWVERAKKRRKGLLNYASQEGLIVTPNYIS